MPETSMLEWLTNTSSDIDLSVTTLAMRLALAWMAGLVIALIARRGTAPKSRNELTLTLILMSILIAMATQIIGDNIARAFSLVGALSIVRFRTAVPATRDVAFVLAAVVVGMAVGAGQYWVCGLGLVTVASATWLGARSSRTNAPTKNVEPGGVNEIQDRWRIAIQVSLNSTINWNERLAVACDRHSLQSAETARRGGALELVFDCEMKPGQNLADIVAQLNSLPGVESVVARQKGTNA